MFPKTAGFLALAALVLLAGCDRKPPRAPDRPPAGAEEGGYAVAPSVQTARAEAGGLRLSGAAPAGGEVRIAEPGGQPAMARADAAGRWAILLPPAGSARIFGLSAATGDRRVQAQGYLVVTPAGPVAQLRSGAGAVRLDPAAGPSIQAIDFDQAGAAVVSGLGAPASPVALWLDGRQVAEGRTDPGGRYTLALSQPVRRGEHALQVLGPGFLSRARAQITPPAPLVAGPMRSQVIEGGVRIDWMTPGGGLQSTILLN